MVLSVKDNSIYENLVKSIRETWGSDSVEGIETIYYYGNNGNEQTVLIRDELFTTSKEGMNNLGCKVIESLEYVLHNVEFDYVFKMNCSSYLNKQALKDLLVGKPKQGYYAGVISEHRNVRFASGAGSILSRDVIKTIVDNKGDWDHSYIEDVSIGKLLSENGIMPSKVDRVDVIHGVNEDLINRKAHHYRCKNKRDRRVDIVIMNELYRVHKNQDNG